MLAAAAGDEAVADPKRRVDGRLADLLHVLTALLDCDVAQVGLHLTAARRDPVVSVDQKAADAVLELGGDRMVLAREQVVGDIGARHRVVGGGEDDLGERLVAEPGAAVALVDGGRGLAGPAEGRDRPDRDDGDEDRGGGREGDPTPASVALRDLGRARRDGFRRRGDQPQKLLHPLEQDEQAGGEDCELDHGVAVRTTRRPAATRIAPRTARAAGRSGTVVTRRQTSSSGRSMRTGRNTERTTAARITPAPAAIKRVVRRLPRKVSQTAATAARVSGSAGWPTTSERMTWYPISVTTAATATAVPSSETSRRQSAASAIPAAPAAIASTRRTIASTRASFARRARPTTQSGGLPSRIFAGALPRIFAATLGASCPSAELTTTPTSATVSVTVFSSCLKIARWTSATAARRRSLNGPLP